MPALDVDVSGRTDLDELTPPCGRTSPGMIDRPERVVGTGDHETGKREACEWNRVESLCGCGKLRTIRIREGDKKRGPHNIRRSARPVGHDQTTQAVSYEHRRPRNSGNRRIERRNPFPAFGMIPIALGNPPPLRILLFPQRLPMSRPGTADAGHHKHRSIAERSSRRHACRPAFSFSQASAPAAAARPVAKQAVSR